MTPRPAFAFQFRVLLQLLALCCAVPSPVFAQDFDKGYQAALAGDFETAFKELRPLADSGNGDAQNILGYMFFYGEGVTQSYLDALHWSRQAAEQGHEQAQFRLGEMYQNGLGVAESASEAARWYRLAAEDGVVGAQFRLGYMYQEGLGVDKDLSQTLYWFQQAAEQGHVTSQTSLGFMYRFGRGTQKDPVKAIHWYRLAAEQGLASAQNNLAEMYQRGEGVPADSIEAIHWYRLAGEQGHEGAQFELGFLYYHGRGVDTDYAEAAKWFQLAAEQGHGEAQSKLGLLYEIGRGVPQDGDKSARLYQSAREQGVRELPERELAYMQYQLGLAEQQFGANSHHVLNPMKEIADIYRFKLSFKDEARKAYQRGFEVARHVLGSDHGFTLEFMSLYGLELSDVGRYAEALEIQQDLVALSRKVLGPTDEATLYRIGALSATLAALGDTTRAHQILLDGVSLAAEVHGEHARIVTSHLGTQIMSVNSEEPNPVLTDLLRSSMEESREISGTSSPRTLFLMREYSEAMSRMDQQLPALEVWSEITSAHQDRLMLSTALDEHSQKAATRDAKQAGLEFATRAWRNIAALTAKTEPFEFRGKEYDVAGLQRRLAQDSFHAVQIGQSGAAQALARSTARIALRDAGLHSMFTDYETAQAEVMKLSDQIASAVSDPARGDDEAILTLQEARIRAIEDVRSIGHLLEDAFPRFFGMLAPQPVTVETLQGQSDIPALLGPNEALIQMIPPRGDTPGQVWAVSRDGFAWAQIDRSEDALRSDLTYLHSLLDGGGATLARGSFSLTEDNSAPSIQGFDRAFAHTLYEALLGDPDIQSVLTSKSEWILAPQGMLLSLPFATLVTSPPEGGAEGDADPEALRNTQWLGTSRALSVVPAVSSLRALRQSAKAATDLPRLPFFGLGDPSFDGGAATDRGMVETAFRSALANPDAVRSLSRLPGTRREITQLAAVFNAPDEAVLFGNDASESRLAKAQSDGVLPQSRVVVLATHGLMAGAFDGLSEPALALTPPACGPVEIGADPQTASTCSQSEPNPDLEAAARNGAWIDDGLLTASEVTQLDLNADWVILSACDTAAGEDQSPDAEGLSGLARAFFFAGARSLLVSHWPVRDDVAALLTPEAVARSADGQISRAEAFRQAMHALINDPSADAAGKSFSHPAAWAPFQVTGVNANGS